MNPLTVRLLCSDFRYVLRKRYRRMKFEPNANVLRVTLLVFSICFGILSVSLIALGVVHTSQLKWPRPYIGLEFVELPVLVIILGSISLVLAFVGCFCAKSYNRTVYFLFGSILCVVLCLEMTIAIIAFRNKGEPRRSRTQLLMEEHLHLNGSEYYFRTIEEHYQCCGITGLEAKCDGKTAGCANKINNALDDISIGIGYSTVVFCCIQVIQILCVFTICFATKM